MYAKNLTFRNPLIRAGFGALALTGALLLPARAQAAEFFLSDFTSATETALGAGSAWEYNNIDKAPWTAGWDNDSSLTFDFGLPIAPGENHRLRAPLAGPTPTFATFPYTKVKVTFTGIPDGQTVLFQIRQELSSGYIKRTWPVGNGTHELLFDGTDLPSFDGGSNDPFNPATATYNRIRLQIDLTTIATWPTDYANVDAAIDYVVITDDPDYGAATEGEGEGTAEGTQEGEGEGSIEGAQEGEGEGEGDPDPVFNYTAQVGDDVTFTVPNPGTAGPGDFVWTFTPQSGGGTQTLTENGASLSINEVIQSDSGTYIATYDNGANAISTFTAILTVVNSLPATSSLALAAIAAALGSLGVLTSRAKSRT